MQELDRSKLGPSEERTIYEVRSLTVDIDCILGINESKMVCYIKVQQGREPLDVDFCSITIDGSLDNDLLQQRLHDVARQRDELQQMEIELRAQVIARTELMEMQNSFDTQIKEHVNAAAKLQV